ncbi:hypothetical protein ACPSVL_001130 [Yersinia enterocolitica]
MVFFAFLTEKLDVDHKKIRKNYQLIQKLAWEQVLLLAIYSRQYCYSPEANPHHVGALARVSLLAHASELSRQRTSNQEDKSPWELTELVTTLLNQGKGSVAIVKQLLKQAEHEESSALSSDCQNLLNRMEREGISFAGGNYPCYSWYTLYIALTDPISLFQELLAIKPLDDEFYYACAIEALKSLLNTSNQSYYMMQFDSSDTALMYRAGLNVGSGVEFRKFFEDHSGAVDKQEYQQSLKSELMRELTLGVRACFAMTSIPQSQQPLTIDPPDVMQRLCRPERKGNNVSLNIDTALLKSLLELGQIDLVMEGIRNNIKDIAAGQWRSIWRITTRAEDYALAFDRLANWFTKCKTPLITAFDQLPRYVGAIIALDVKHRQGMFSEKLRVKQLKGLPQKLSAKDVALITTYLFYYSLTHNVNPLWFIERSFLSKPENQCEVEVCLKATSEHVDTERELQPWAMTTMASWQDRYQPEQAMERIKKIPNYLKFGGKRNDLTTFEWINVQRIAGISGEVPWPIDTPFPLPLWAGLSLTTTDDNV